MSIIFQRRSNTGKRKSNAADLLVFVAKSRSKLHMAVGLRLSPKALRELRWRVGDYVVAAFDPPTKRWTLCMSSDDVGNKLSGKHGSDGAATVRFSVKDDDLQPLGLGDASSYDCMMVSADTKECVFERLDD